MARPARCRVTGRFDAGGGVRQATIIVDRAAHLFTVRPYRRRQVFTLPLATVAEIVVWRVVRAGLAQERRAKTRRTRRSS
jgi:hypothetical protein